MKVDALTEIDEIFQQYEEAENKDELDKRLRELGEQIETENSTDRKRKIDNTLKKGQNMTYSDVYFLIENEVDKDQIRKELGMSKRNFYEYVRNHRKKGNKAEYKNWNWSPHEIGIIKGALAEGKTIGQIAIMLEGRTKNAISTIIYKRKLRERG